ncbi:unnamed protein product [Adineta ricciae]|uniref:G-protein coupled receptors family 1 profile domain-containing protein n=1 Tax=Adineta ricciae TaxID=249248 RepID=A0A814KNM1_ADIRI|nr:unnamed protein product [Adineta ricciae]CAF1115701.1 unnamed protein product [Adineta ricciae]
MNDSNTSVVDDDSTSNLGMSQLERGIKFYCLISLLIPSVALTGFILYHFRWRYIQCQIYGFVLIVNALIITVELPITLYYLNYGTIYSESRCSAWITLNYSLFQLSIFLMTWTSIERYLFIYHEHFIMRHLILLHYVPIIFFSLYCPLLYTGIVILNTCQPVYDVHLYICGGPCYSLVLTTGLLDWIGNGMSMEMTTLLMNIILIIRHFIQRHRMKKAILTAAGRQQWTRSAKLALQLLAIGMAYIIAWIPYSIIVLIQMFQNSERLAYILSTVFVYLPYLQSLILPYLCMLFIPDIKQKFFALQIFSCFGRIQRHQNRVQPFDGQLKTATIQTRTYSLC